VASGIEMAWVTNVIGSVVLSHQSDGAGFHPQIDVLADEEGGLECDVDL
jgi:hypothetical protein